MHVTKFQPKKKHCLGEISGVRHFMIIDYTFDENEKQGWSHENR